MSTSAGSVAIEDVSVGDRVVAQASDVEVGAEQGWEALSSECVEPSWVSARTLRAGEVLVYSARTGQWQVAPRSTLTSGTTWWSEGRLHRGGDDLGSVVVEELRDADATYDAGAEHLAPCAGSWVLVLEDGGARHARLSTVPAGAVVAYQGRLLEVGAGRVRATGEVLSRVVETFSRTAEGLYEVEAELPDGELVWLNATAEHPFYSVDAGKYVSVRELGVGSRLHVEGGGEALLVSKTWRQGGVEVFNFEVEGEHNYFVGGVLTHNAKKKAACDLGTCRKPRNGHLAGGVHPRTKVPFNAAGYPVFKVISQVVIEPGSSRGQDFARADAAARASGQAAQCSLTTWHHNEQYGVMQLVGRLIHSKTGHSGGYSLWGAGNCGC